MLTLLHMGSSKASEEFAFKYKGYGYIKMNTIWCTQDGNVSTKIYVCWENPTTEDSAERNVVKESISRSWEYNSNITFLGWEKCSKNSSGIRIKIDDSGPHTKGLGRELNNKKDGMILNFSFKNWGESCLKEDKNLCIKSIAVHEFGHALGFSHEHNRTFDRPGECMKAPQGSDGDATLTPYDKDSVMNYCNKKYNNYGELSDLDIKSINIIYGGEQRYGFCN